MAIYVQRVINLLIHNHFKEFKKKNSNNITVLKCTFQVERIHLHNKLSLNVGTNAYKGSLTPRLCEDKKVLTLFKLNHI